MEALDSDSADTIAQLRMECIASCTSFPELLLVKLFADIELAFRFFNAHTMNTFIHLLKKQYVLVNTHSTVKSASRKCKLLDSPTSPPSLKKTNATTAVINRERSRFEVRRQRKEVVGNKIIIGSSAMEVCSSSFVAAGDARGAENTDPNAATAVSPGHSDQLSCADVVCRPPSGSQKLRSFKLPDIKKK